MVKPDESASSSSGSSSESSGSESSGSGTASASGAATEPPPEAQKNTKAGAEAFAKWYYEQVGEATVTGDVSVLREVSEQGCKICQATADKTAQGAEKYGRVKSNPYTVTLVDARKDSGRHVVRVKVKYDDYYFVDERGEEAARVKGNEYGVTLFPRWHSNHWQMSDWVIVL
ncbi:hypothetical protein GCM10022199_16870 [Marihabitans asiaticum]